MSDDLNINVGDEALYYVRMPVDEPMTKREKIAAMAMQGILSNPESSDGKEKKIISYSVHLADKLLKKLEATSGE